MPLVSIIIPTYNSQGALERCLRSIVSQRYSSIELIMVDQQSTDDTRAIGARYGAKILFTRRSKFYSPPSKSRNIGAKHSRGKFLLHVDSDMELTPTVIEECVSACMNGGAGAVVIHETDISEGFWGNCKVLERSMYYRAFGIEAARFFKREYFEQIGGYDEKISSGEDWDIHHRISKICAVRDVNSPLKHHIGKITLRNQILKKFNYGKSMHAYIAKEPVLAIYVAMGFARAYARNLTYFGKDPVHFFGAIILRLLELISASIGLVIGRLSHESMAADSRSASGPNY